MAPCITQALNDGVFLTERDLHVGVSVSGHSFVNCAGETLKSHPCRGPRGPICSSNSAEIGLKDT